MQIKDSRVLVTGGGSGIGLAIARRLAEGGARVAIAGRRVDLLKSSAASFGGLAVPCDVTDEDQVRRMVETVVESFGGLDVVINNAAAAYRAPLLEVERERFDAVFAANVTGAMLVARESARQFVQAGGGTIFNVGSTAAGKGYPGGSAYSGSKFALSGLTECWRAELRPHNVRVMQVDPSEVLTEFGGREQSDNPTKLVADDVAQLVVSLLALDDRGFVTRATLWATNPREV